MYAVAWIIDALRLSGRVPAAAGLRSLEIVEDFEGTNEQTSINRIEFWAQIRCRALAR